MTAPLRRAILARAREDKRNGRWGRQRRKGFWTDYPPGHIDGYWELRLGPWDVAAGSLMVEEAGGRMTSLTGGALDLMAPEIVASNGHIHDEMLETLREVQASRPA